jgi:hypothetical protein
MRSMGESSAGAGDHGDYNRSLGVVVVIVVLP